MQKLVSLFIIVVTFLPLLTFAQTSTVPASLQGANTAEVTIPNGAASCFDYYTTDSVQIDVEPVSSVAAAGTPFAFVGSITNNNPYPIVNGSIFVKIFKLEDGGVNSGVTTQSVTNQFFASSDISLSAHASKVIEIPFAVPSYSVNGKYGIATYFVMNDRFSLEDLSSASDNPSVFNIEGGQTGGVAFDSNGAYLNDVEYRFAASSPHFTKDETVVLSVPVVNTTAETINAIVDFELFNGDSIGAKNILDTKKEGITLAPGEEKVLLYEATKATGAVTLIRATLTYNKTTSILNTRFERDGIAETRLIFPGITSYPLEKGKEITLFTCLQSTDPSLAEGDTLTLTLSDLEGKTIHSYTYEGGVIDAVMAVKDSFKPEDALTDFTLTASLSRDGQLIEEVTSTYRCVDIDTSLCVAEEDGTNLLVITTATLLLIAAIFMILKHRGYFTPSLAIAFTLIALGTFSPQAEARTESSVGSHPGVLWARWDSHDYSVVGRPDLNSGYNGAIGQPKYSVDYSAAAKNTDSGQSYVDVPYSPYDSIDPSYSKPVSVGERITFTPKALENADITWNADFPRDFIPNNKVFMEGGYWRTDASAPPQSGRVEDGFITYSFDGTSKLMSIRKFASCESEDYFFTSAYQNPANIAEYVSLVMDPVAPTYTSSANLTCGSASPDGSVSCVVNAPGKVTFAFRYPDTYGYFYHRFYDPRNENTASTRREAGCYGTSEPVQYLGAGDLGAYNPAYRTSFKAKIFAKSIEFAFWSAYPPGLVPNAPEIKGNSDMTVAALSSGNTGANIPFFFRADHPDGDSQTIKYEFKWSDIAASSSLPVSGYVADRTVLGTSRTFTNPGTYTLSVIVVDDDNNRSVATQHTISISSPGVTTLTTTDCTIPAGASTCTTTLTWNAPGTTAPWEILHNNKTPSPEWVPGVSGSSGSVSYAIASGVQTFVLQSDSINLIAAGAIATCAAGSTWNGSVCAAAGSVALFNAPAGCVVAVGASSCDITVNWDLTGQVNPSIRNASNATTISTAISSPGQVVTLPYRSIPTQLTANATQPVVSISTPGSTLTATTCVIPTGASTCTIVLTWSAPGFVAPWEILHNNKTPAPDWVPGVSGSSGNVSYAISYGAQNFVLQSDSTNLTSASGAASCAPGSSWNGSVCAIGPGPVFDPSGNIVLVTREVTTTCATGSNWNGTTCTVPPPSATFTAPASCTIPLGGTACTVNVDWNLTGQTNPNITNSVTGDTLYTTPTGTNQPVTLPYRSAATALHARTGSTLLVAQSVDTNCALLTSWNGSNCVLLPPPPPPPPVVNMTVVPTPQFIRSGDTADIKIEVESTAILNCTHRGIQSTPGNFIHDPLLGTRSTRTIQTRPLTSAQKIIVECTDPISSSVSTSEALVNVVPIYEEI